MENRTFTTSVQGITLLKKLVDNQINLGVHTIDDVPLIQLYNQLDSAREVRAGYVTLPKSYGNTEGTRDYALFYHSGEKVPVIKLIREITGLGLKEAKDLSDQSVFCPTANAFKLVMKNVSPTAAQHVVRNLDLMVSDRWPGRLVYIDFRSDIGDDSLVVPYQKSQP